MTRFQRAQQLWSVLVLGAKFRHVYTYGELAAACGAPSVAVGGFLEPIQAYCLARNLPPLTVLAVNAETGLPGVGFVAAQDVPRAQMAVFHFDWLRIQSPTDQELAG